MTRLTFLFPVVLLTLASCSKDGCNDKLAFNYDVEGTTDESCVYEPLQVEIQFSTAYGETALSAGESPTQLSTADGRKLVVDYFGIYLTEMSFEDRGTFRPLGNGGVDCISLEDESFLLKEDNRTFTSTYLPRANSDITAVHFNLGVDSCRNLGIDPSTKLSGPFAPQNPTMYWSWASGFRFVSIEGMVDVSNEKDGSDMQKFEFHTGLNSLLREVELDLTDLERIDGKLLLHVEVDFETVFTDVDFTTERVTHTMGNMPLALKITENTNGAFSVK